MYDCACALEHAWRSADLQLQLSVYLLTGVVVLWLLIGIAWWIYGEAISNLFELKSMKCITLHLCCILSRALLKNSSLELSAVFP